MKTIQLSVTDFAVPSPLSGDIDTYSGFGPLPNVGSAIHALVQEQRLRDFPAYVPERWVTHTFEHGEMKVTISGRMDGYLAGPEAWIEEIKSAYNPEQLVQALRKNPDHPYLLQLKTYAYIQYLHSGAVPRITLHIVSSRTRKAEDFPTQLDVTVYEAWLQGRLGDLLAEHYMFESLKKRRRKLAKSMKFPFEEPRQGQTDLMATVEKNLRKDTPMLLQAPTGLGKTAGVLIPTLREAMQRGQKVIYLTPKNSQHAVAEDAVRRLQEAGSKVKAVTLHAKSKMCLKEQTLCNPSYCEYARAYYDKVASHGLVEKLAKKKNLSARTFQKIGREYEVCPFELQLDTLHRADVVIGDYNYVFSPRNSLARLSRNGFGKKSQANLVVDEVHNLPSRATDYFSAVLSSTVLRELWMGFGQLASTLNGSADDLLRSSLQLISDYATEKPSRVELDPEKFIEQGARVSEFLARYLESPADMQPGDNVLKFCNLWSDFAQAIENLSEEFFCTFTPSADGGALKIICCDASAHLREGYSAFANVVAFSATVKPFSFYSKLLGFDDLKNAPLCAEFFSPFPRERRKLLIIPQISTKYSDREANYGKIRDAIERIVRVHEGNYFVFFPSFDFLGRVANLLSLPEYQVLQQRREMPRKEIESYIETLKERSRPTLVLAVQGGVFSEGVDYPGEMLVGAIVVGPALPSFDFERELLREYYAKKHGSDCAFDYAYTYPAMAKVVQSAGRVIRSQSDRGLIVLMDRRFMHRNYVKSMPGDWVGDEPNAYVSQQLLGDIRRFWDENAAEPE